MGPRPPCRARMGESRSGEGAGVCPALALRLAPEGLNLAGLLGPDLPLDLEE